jgi:hypothetical protein
LEDEVDDAFVDPAVDEDFVGACGGRVGTYFGADA